MTSSTTGKKNPISDECSCDCRDHETIVNNGDDDNDNNERRPSNETFHSSANINVTINNFSRSPNVINGLQNFFMASDDDKHLTILLGHHQIINSSSAIFNVAMPQVPDMRGFPGGYFHIRAAGTQHYWAIHYGETGQDGNAVCLWPSVKNDKAAFFFNSKGELCTNGAQIDVMNNTLIVTHDRPHTTPWPNPWSHPLPSFSYSQETRMISVKFYADPLISSDWPRPEKEWKDKEFIVAARPPTPTKVHHLNEISEWAPRSNFIRWTNRAGDKWQANGETTLGIEEKEEMTKSEDANSLRWVLEQV